MDKESKDEKSITTDKKSSSTKLSISTAAPTTINTAIAPATSAAKAAIAITPRRRVTRTTVPPFDINDGPDSVGYLFEFLFSLKPTSPVFNETFVELSRKHPYIKQKKKESDGATCSHRFEVYGFSVDHYKFGKWIKTDAGKAYRSIAGGNSDDALYTVSKVLRKTLPRGCHYIKATHKTTNKQTEFLFRGIPKFTGLLACDEDEISNSSADLFYFIQGKRQADATMAYETEKSNGENCRVAVMVADGVRYLVSGGKNTCHIWPAKESFNEWMPKMFPAEKLPEENDGLPHIAIGRAYSRWFRALSDKEQDSFVDALWKRHGGHCTLVGEVNRPWEEHVVAITGKQAFVELFTCVGPDGRPLPPKTCFELFAEFNIRTRTKKDAEHSEQMYHVLFEHFDMNDLDKRVADIRKRKDTEGSVLYLCDSGANALAFVKVKSSDYVIHRRLRAILKKHIIQPLAKGMIKGFPPAGKPCKQQPWQSNTLAERLAVAEEYLTKGIRMLTHVPGCNNDTTEFAAVKADLATAKLEQKTAKYIHLGCKEGIKHVEKLGKPVAAAQMLLQDSIAERARKMDRMQELVRHVKKFPGEKKMWNTWFSFAWAFAQWLVETYLAHSDKRKRDQPLLPTDPWYAGKKLDYPGKKSRKKKRGKKKKLDAVDSSATPSFDYSIEEAQARSKRLVNRFQSKFGSLVVEFKKAQRDGWKPLDK